MKFLLDEHIPPSLAERLRRLGHDAIHVFTLPTADGTPDADIIATADREGRIVVTKDSDFRDSQVISGRPARLLRVTTGNSKNNELIALFLAGLPEIEKLFEDFCCVELTRSGVSSCA
jgi:predicted nuclease of predicted toxin-antitoxin system